MKIVPIKQRDESACGPASIQMAVNYFKLPITYDQIANTSQYKKKDGLCNVDLINTLKELGFSVKKRQIQNGKILLVKINPTKWLSFHG